MLVFLEKVMVQILLIVVVLKMSVHQPSLESIPDIQASDD
jgi:hypothetical protein